MFTKIRGGDFVNAVDYEILRCISDEKKRSQREIASVTGFSLGKVNKSLSELKKARYISDDFSENRLPTP